MKCYMNYLVIFVLITMSMELNAQDTIHTRDNKTILAKVIQIGKGELVYKLWTQPTGPTRVMMLDRVERIVYQDGMVEFPEKSYNTEPVVRKRITSPKKAKRDITVVIDQPEMNIFKVRTFGPMFNFGAVSWERNMKKNRSLEMEAGVIGLGLSPFSEGKGGYMSFAIKHSKNRKSIKHKSVTQTYNKLELTAGQHSYVREPLFSDPISGNTNYVSAISYLGTQLIGKKGLVIDVNFGLGIGSYSDSKAGGYHYNTTIISEGGAGLAIGGGFKMGWNFR